nr:uncharacterized mitochondrial protein AtMg00810-like [Tanacetum cinerariifolium]
MAGDDENATNPPPVLATQQAPHTLSTIKLPILKKGVSTEDVNKKFLRSLPSSWSQVSLIIRTKPGVDTLSFDYLYNNLRVFESDVKGSTASSSSTQNVVFVFSNSTSSTNEVDKFDLKEMDLKWQVAMISMRLKKFYKKTRRKLHFDAKEPVGFDKTKFECFNCHNIRHFAKECRSKGNQESRRRDAGNTGYKARDNERRPTKQDEPKSMVTIDGDGVDWTGHAEDDIENYTLMVFNSSNPSSDTKVTYCSNVCEESYAKLKKLYDKQRKQIGDASIEIQAYTLALKKVEAQLVCHQKINLLMKKKIRFMKIDLDDKTNVLIYHKKLIAEAEKEKEELKTKLKNFQSSSKGLSKLLNSQMSTKDKSGLGNVEDNPMNDRYAKVEEMHAVPPPMTGIYMPPKFDFGIDESKLTYGPKQYKTSESDAKTSDLASCESNSSVETLESVPKPVESKPKAVSEPKVWQTVKDQDTCSQNLKVPKRGWTGLMFKRLGLGYGYTRKACFVCGSFSHLIRDCDFHKKRMAKQVELNKIKNKDNPQQILKGKAIFDSGCSRHMTGNKAYLVEYQDFNGGPVAFGGIKKEYSNARTPQQNGVAKKKKRTLIEAAKTLLAYSFLPNTFWAEAVSTTCYVLNRPVTAENKANKTKGPNEANNSAVTQDNIDARNSTMEDKHAQEYFVLPLWSSYTLTVKRLEAKNRDEKLNGDTGSKTNKKPVDQDDQALLEELERLKRQEKEADDAAKTLRKTFAQSTEDLLLQAGAARASSTNYVNIVRTLFNTASPSRNVSAVGPSYCDLSNYVNQDDSQIPSLEDIYEVLSDGIFTSASYDDEGAVADFTNLESTVNVTPKTSHLHFVKRIFRYLKGQPKLGLWYPRELAFDLEAYSDSDYAGANLDKKATTGGCQFLGRKLISWQCKKQIIVATFTTKAEYVAAANCCGYHFIRDAYEKKLIQAKGNAQFHEIVDLVSRIYPFRSGFSKKSSLGDFNKLDDLVDEGADYAVNEGRSTYKIKVLNAKAKEVSTVGETLNAATLAVSTASVQTVLEQTALGKDFSNPLMADSLPKNYMVLNSPCFTSKELACPKQTALEQTATGKETSNPFMAGSLSKTTSPT